jgi:hypothetical protein
MLALSECLKNISVNHPLRRKVKIGDSPFKKESHQVIYHLLQEKLKKTWEKDHALSVQQKELVLKALYLLKDEKYYLDLFLIKLIFYKKIGNNGRVNELIKEWLNLSPFELIAHSPHRDDALSEYLQLQMLPILESLQANITDRFLWELLMLKISWIYQDKRLNDWIEKERSLSSNEIIEELKLKHQKLKSGVFGHWVSNQILEGIRYEKFLLDQVPKISSGDLWIFLMRPPESIQARDQLLARLSILKNEHPEIYESFINIPLMRQGLVKFSPDLLKNYLKSKRDLLHHRLKEKKGDIWSLYELLRLGEITSEVFNYWY